MSLWHGAWRLRAENAGSFILLPLFRLTWGQNTSEYLSPCARGEIVTAPDHVTLCECKSAVGLLIFTRDEPALSTFFRETPAADWLGSNICIYRPLYCQLRVVNTSITTLLCILQRQLHESVFVAVSCSG